MAGGGREAGRQAEMEGGIGREGKGRKEGGVGDVTISAAGFVRAALRHNIWKMEAGEAKTLVKHVRPDWSTRINVYLNTTLIGR